MEKLYVNARLSVKESSVTTVWNILQTLAKHSEQEAGCESYGIFQSAESDTCFMTFEIWLTPEAEERHWLTPHLLDALQDLEPHLTQAADVKKYAAIPL